MRLGGDTSNNHVWPSRRPSEMSAVAYMRQLLMQLPLGLSGDLLIELSLSGKCF